MNHGHLALPVSQVSSWIKLMGFFFLLFNVKQIAMHLNCLKIWSN